MKRTLRLRIPGARCGARLLLGIAALGALGAAGHIDAAPPPLVHLYTFQTPDGLSADDLVYDPIGGHLVFVGVNPRSVLWETTIRGELLAEHPDLGSNSLTRATRGATTGHFFQASGGGGSVTVSEFDETFTKVKDCLVQLSLPDGVPSVPGDALAFNHYRQTFLVSDLPANLIHEVDCRGEGTFIRSVAPVGFDAPAGMVFDVATGTYFGVHHMDSVLVQFDDVGTLIRSFPLAPYGVVQPVGITIGQGKIFVTDELRGEENDKTGYIFAFRTPAPAR